MTRRLAAALLCCLPLLAAAPDARAGAYALHEFSAISSGRSHATAARLDSPETMFMNPAGLATLDGLQASLNGSLVFGGTTWSDPAGEKPSADMDIVQLLPSVAVSYRYAEWGSAGVGFAAPFGLDLDWPAGWAGEGATDEVSLKVPNVYAVAAFQPLEGLYLAAAFHYAPASAKLVQSFGRNSEGVPASQISVDGTGNGFGGGFGVMYRPGMGLHFGLSYKSRMKIDMTGTGVAGPPGSEEVSGSTTIWTPDEVNLAAGWAPNQEWYVEADVSLQVWNMVDELALQIGEGQPRGFDQDYGNSWLYKVGVEFQPFDALGFRAGVGYETTPVPDRTLSPVLPDADRILASVGLTLDIPGVPLSVDAAYFRVQFMDRTVTADENVILPSTYEVRANWVALSLRFTGTEL